MAGLFTKYGGRCGPTATIWIEENNTVVEKNLGEIPLKIPAREQLPEKKPTEKYEREVGIYAVCHGITPGNDIAGGIERVVAAFKEVLPDEQRVVVSKIALVQCFAAAAATVAKEGLFGTLNRILST